MPQGYDLLAVTRIQAITEVLLDELIPLNSLAFLNATPIVPAQDEEIMGLHEHYTVSADIIPDDQRAFVRGGGRVTLSTTAIPNIKQGSLITQAMLNLLRRINNGGGIPSDNGIIRDYIAKEVASKINANRIMMNRMIAGMHMNQFSYSKAGVIYSNVDWGMDPSQKFVPSIAWTDPTNGTPIDDLLLYKRQNIENFPYVNYDYLRCSTSLMHAIIATTNFKNYAKLYSIGINLSNTLAQQNVAAMVPILEAATGLTWIPEDAFYRDELNDGTTVSGRYQPANIAIMGSKSDLNNAGAMDFGNAIVNETEVGVVAGTTVIGGGFPAPAYGPVSYATLTPDLNPPNITIWGVTRGFPRKKNRYATARITAYPA